MYKKPAKFAKMAFLEAPARAAGEGSNGSQESYGERR